MKKNNCLIVLLFVPALLFAQGKGVIKGSVYDETTNEPLPFASVVIWGTNIGAVSDLDGNFLFTGIEPGYIQVVASSVGFEDYISGRFMVTNANVAFVDIPMANRQLNINEVVVKASLFRKKEESPVSLQRIGIEQIEKNPGGNRDISKVLQSLPGVASGVSFRNDVIVRGGGPNENAFYLDGVEIPTINHFATQGSSGGPVGMINVDFIREVNFYSGAFPVNIGNALSSVIDMRMVDGNKDKLKFRGSVGSSDLALTLDGPISDNSTFIVSARRSYLQFLFAALELPFLPTYNDFQFKIKSKLNDKNELSLIGLGAIDQFELNLDADQTTEQKYILSALPVNEQWNYTVGGVYKHYRERGYNTFVLSRNHLNNTSFKHIDNDEDLPKLLDYSSAEIENKIRFEHYVRFNNALKLNFGAGLVQATYSNRTKRQFYGNNGLEDVNYSSNLDVWHYSMFLQSGKSFFDNRLMVSYGVRADGSNYSSEMNNPFENGSPRLSLSYLLADKLSLNANVGRYYQRPPYTALGYKDLSGRFVNKTSGLKFIESDHIVAGFEVRPTKQSVISLEGFFKLYSDYPFSLKDSVPLSSKGADFGTFGDEQLVPVSTGRAYGFEVLGRSQDLFGFNTIFSYTYVRSEFKNERKSISADYIPSSWDNKHLLNITGTITFKKSWYFGFKWRYVGGSPYTAFDSVKSSLAEAWDATGAPYLDYTSFNQLRLTSFHQLDIRVDKEFFFEKWSLNIYVDVQNVYNFRNKEPDVLTRRSFVEEGYNDFIPGGGAEPDRYELVNFASSGSGSIVPAIGIIVEF